MDNKYVKSYGNFQQYRPPRLKTKKSFWSRLSSQKNSTPSYYRDSISSIKKTRLSLKKTILFVLMAGAVLTWLGLMLYLPYFRVGLLTFEGLNIIQQSEIENYVRANFLDGGFVIPKNNFFLISVNKINKAVVEKYAVQSVVTTKIFPKEIKIVVEEKISSIIYDNGSDYSLLDNSGAVVKMLSGYDSPVVMLETPIVITTSSVTSTLAAIPAHLPEYRKLTRDYGNLPILYDTRAVPVYENKKAVLPSGFIQFLIDWQEIVKQEGIGEVKYYETDGLKAGVTVYLNRPWKIFIQPENSLNEQIENLKVIISSRNAKPNEYIDLRYGDKVYWK